MLNSLLRLLIIVAVLVLAARSTFAQCNNGVVPFSINDQLDSLIVINIAGSTNNDLSNPSQGICGISLNFRHDAVSDIAVELYSPSGQSVQLIGDVCSFCPNTLNSEWDITFVSCSDPTSPDPGIASNWANDENWTNFGNYSGTYYPYSGCLEDFNSGSVNGNWVLRVIDGLNFNQGDLIDFEITFCDGSGISCQPCAADAGLFSNSMFQACTNEDVVIFPDAVGQQTDVDYGYYYILHQNDQVISISETPEFGRLSSGMYSACGLSIPEDALDEIRALDIPVSELSVSLFEGSLGICGEVTRNCAQIEVIDAGEPKLLFEEICQGESFNLNGSSFSQEGVYETRIPGEGQCDTLVLLYLEVIELIPNIIANPSNLSCSNETIELNAGFSQQEDFSDFTWSSADGVLEGNPKGPLLEINYPGTYLLTQEEKGCVEFTSITIDPPLDIPTISLFASEISCSQHEVFINVASPTNIETAEWTGPNGFTSSEIQPLVDFPGDYYVRFVDENGCIIQDRLTVNQASELAKINLSSSRISCANPLVEILLESDLQLIDVEWLGPNGFTSGDLSPMVSEVGSYFLSALDINGCKAYASIFIDGNPQELDYEIYANDFQCNGGWTEIGVNFSGMDPIVNWTGPSGFFSDEQFPLVRYTGTYYLELIYEGCRVTDSINVDRDVSDLPAYDTEIIDIGSCENAAFELNAIPLSNEEFVKELRWYKSGLGLVEYGPTTIVNEFGAYFLLAITYNGCFIYNHFTIDPPAEVPQINIESKGDVNCYNGLGNGFINLQGDDVFIYEWEGPNGFLSSEKNIENLEHGNYYLTVTDPITGCTRFLQEIVRLDTVPRILTINNTDISCVNDGAIIQLSSNSSVDSIIWSGPSGFSNGGTRLSVSDPGFYFVDVYGRNGCLTRDTVEIMADYEKPSATLIDTSLNCSDRSVQLSPMNVETGYTYSWNGPESFQSSSFAPVVYAAGDYELEITGLNGCVDTFVVNVSSDPNLPTAFTSSTGILTCEQTTVGLMGNADHLILQYIWEGPNNFLSLDQNPLIVDPGIYYLNVEDDQGCVGTDSVIVEQFIVLPDFVFETDRLSCIQSKVPLIVSSTDPGAEFAWSGPGLFSSSDTIEVTQPGTYTLSVTGSNQCEAIEEIEVLADTLDINLDRILNCNIPSLSLNDTLSNDLSYSATWTGPDGYSSLELAPEVNQNGIYIGEVVGNNGCMVNLIANVSLDTISPTANATVQGRIKCDIQEFILSGESSSLGTEYSYNWTSPDGVVSGTVGATISEGRGKGTYILEVQNLFNGCTSYDTVLVIEEMDTLGFEMDLESPECYGVNTGIIEVNRISGLEGEAEFSIDGFIFGPENKFTNLAPGTYEVFVRDSFGCISSQFIEIQEAFKPELELGDDMDVFLGDEIEVSATTNLTDDQIQMIIWNIPLSSACSDCLSFEISPIEDIEINLTLMDTSGCEISDRVFIRVDQEPILYKPNAFSPNGDGYNDLFYLFANKGVASIKRIEIFDRWGSKLFQRSNILPGDPDGAWDGYHKGKVVLNGVYFYVAEVETITGFTRTIKGDVTVLK